MAARTHPWLADIARTVRAKIDQPNDEQGQMSWSFDAEFTSAANDEYDYLWERVSSQDRNFGVVWDDTVSVASGDETTDLPVACRALRRMFFRRGTDICGAVQVGVIDEMGAGGCSPSAIYMPDDNAIRWTRPWTSAQDFRVVYCRHPIPLVFGCVSTASGALTIALGDHESVEDDMYVGLEILAYGDGAPCSGQSRTISGYSGSTRVATVSVAWVGTPPDERTKYASRPSFRWDFKDAFTYGIISRMMEKHQDERWMEYTTRREQHLRHLQTATMLTAREQAMETLDTSDTGGHGDTLWTAG